MSKKVCSLMKSSISYLPDDLLLKILSFLSTKHVVVTSLLSKKWKSLWTMVPRLEYSVKDHKSPISFQRFIDESLFAHKSHVLESISIEISFKTNIGPWIRTVFHHHHCHLRELEIVTSVGHTPLPHELFTCKTLVVLKLKGESFDVKALTTVCLPSLKVMHIDHSYLFECRSLQMLLTNCNFLTDLMVIRRSRSGYLVEFDVSRCKTLVSLKLEGLKYISTSSSSSSAVCLPFLNTLHVAHMVNLNNDSLCRLLSNCPLLSDLTLDEKASDVILDSEIVMPCLQRLSIIAEVINCSKNLCSLLEKYIQKLEIIAPSHKYLSIKGSFSSPYTLFYARHSSIFCRIVHLELSLCIERAGEMLVDLLLRIPKLVVLKLKNVYILFSSDHWDTPGCVPKCLLSSLEALEWRGYTGRVRDKDLLSYLLNHSLCLKTAKIFFDLKVKQQSTEDVASMPRGSKSCQLVLK